MSTPAIQRPTPAARRKISAGAITVRLILFIFFLSLPFLAAGTLAWS
jgi:hypothetical protein